MVTSTSRFAYSDCFDLMDKAIADPKGIKVKFSTREDAWHFRIRLHTARKIDRLDNMSTYPDTHAMHGKSPYDALTMRIREQVEGVWLRLERIDAREFEIASLSEPEVEPELFGQPVTAMIKSRAEKIEEHVTEPIRKIVRRL